MSSKKLVSSLALALGLFLDLCVGSGLCASMSHESHGHHHHCDHGHGHHRHKPDHYHHHHYHEHDNGKELTERKLPEELAEEEDMRLYGFGPYDDHGHDHDHDSQLSGLGLWFRALGCSLLVSLASLICLIILPIIFVQGKPSKAVVDSLALFGAGAMLGDAFLHQLPHAFGGEHSHSHHVDHGHHLHSGHEHSHSHSHSLKDLSVGMSVLAGIVLFLVVEKLVRFVEENSGGVDAWGSGHHHHHHKSTKKLKDEDNHGKTLSQTSSNERKSLNKISDDSLDGEGDDQPKSPLRKRMTSTGYSSVKPDIDAADVSKNNIKLSDKEELAQSSNLVFGYLNLFSDGVHNFTDGMALGSAFLLYGSVGGWSRTLFLLAHELPQEVGDFGILVRSGFSVFKALFFNFLSALVALAGTATALLWGQDPGQSSLIEGFTAGGFIYISVAGVLAEMNNTGKTTLKSTALQLTSLVLGMVVALCISLVE